MVDRLRILVESRIPGDRYVRFGGEYMETYYSNIERRWVLSLLFKKAGYIQPRTAWSPSLFPAKRLVKAAAPGNVFGIYFPALQRIAHCGFVLQVKSDWIGTIEANTSLPGSREGDGVYARTRHFRTIRCYADWIGKGGVQ